MVPDFGRELPAHAFTLQHGIEIDMRCHRPVAADEFQRFKFEFSRRLEHILKGQSAKTVCDRPDLHGVSFPYLSKMDRLEAAGLCRGKRCLAQDHRLAAIVGTDVRPTAGLDAGDEAIEFGGIGLGVALDKEVERLVG